jgi:hypothetical protein
MQKENGPCAGSGAHEAGTCVAGQRRGPDSTQPAKTPADWPVAFFMRRYRLPRSFAQIAVFELGFDAGDGR